MKINEKKAYFLETLYKLLDKYDNYSQDEKVKVKDYLILVAKQLNDVWLLDISIYEIEKRLEYCIGLLLGATIINVEYVHLDIKNILKGKVRVEKELEKLKIVKRINMVREELDKSDSEEDKEMSNDLKTIENIMVGK